MTFARSNFVGASKKLEAVMRDLREMACDASDTHVFKWWVKASYPVHLEFSGDTGGLMKMGKGNLYGNLAGDRVLIFPHIEWVRSFLRG